jgi:hypothetical protein
MSTHEEDQLRAALRAEAARAGTGGVDLDAVTTRARGMRRRRTAFAGLVTAAVAALAVPTGIQVNTALGDNDAPTPPVASQAPEPVGRVTLDVDRLPTGDGPGVAWLEGTTLVRTDGTATDLGADHDQLAAFGDGYAVQRLVDTDTGERVVEVLDADGDVTWSSPTIDAFAVSPDGTLLVIADPRNRLLLLQAGETTPTPLDEAQNSQPVAPVAVTGSAPCESDCLVYYAVSGPDAGVNVLDVADGHLENAGPFERLDAVTADGRRAGQVSSDAIETTSCSAVLEGRRQLWRTCDHSLSDFSPDGRHLVGTDAYLDGLGRSMVALLDAGTGDPVVTYEVDTRAGDLIADWAWEDDEHLLLTVHSGGDWQVVRVGLDGTAERATDPVAGEDHQSPLVLGNPS